MLRVIGAGLGRTGTRSLNSALQVLGLRSIHFDIERLNDILEGATIAPDFRRYDDIDAVTDVPAAIFYRELAEAYPEAKVVLTVREVESWWRSIELHFTNNRITNERRLVHRIAGKLGVPASVFGELPFDSFRRRVRHYVYGSTTPQEYLYKKRYLEHNALVMATIAPERLLVMDIGAGDGWQKLCPFLGYDVPNVAFPHEHTSPPDAANDQGSDQAAPVLQVARNPT